MTNTTLFDRDRVEGLLRELATELAERGVHGRLFVVGGAAMALAYGRGRVTRDIDGVFEPASVVRDAARVVARRHGLPHDWLDDGVKGFLHGSDPDATTFLDEPGLTVQIASPRYLFVLKALSARVDRDAQDLVTLYRLCGFEKVDEALDHLHRSAPASLVRPKAEYVLRELLGDV